jgi:flagellar basal-body rod modification protein FlgD
MSTTAASTLSSIQGSAAAAPQSSPTKTLGKDDFLLLLTTQLQHQDPLAPMDSQAFVAQLAQFASVESLDGLGTKLDTMLLGQASANQMSTASLVGKEAVFRTDHVSLAPGAPAGFEVTLPSATTATTALIADQNGRVVRTLPLGARSAGTLSVSWDGLDDGGAALPPGDYVITIAASAQDGTRVDAAAAVRGIISGVTFENQAPELIVLGRHVRMSDVLQIGSPSAGA